MNTNVETTDVLSRVHNAISSAHIWSLMFPEKNGQVRYAMSTFDAAQGAYYGVFTGDELDACDSRLRQLLDDVLVDLDKQLDGATLRLSYQYWTEPECIVPKEANKYDRDRESLSVYFAEHDKPPCFKNDSLYVECCAYVFDSTSQGLKYARTKLNTYAVVDTLWLDQKQPGWRLMYDTMSGLGYSQSDALTRLFSAVKSIEVDQPDLTKVEL